MLKFKSTDFFLQIFIDNFIIQNKYLFKLIHANTSIF